MERVYLIHFGKSLDFWTHPTTEFFNSPKKSTCLQVLDFDATLSGMMGALAEIQRKGDSMLGSIR